MGWPSRPSGPMVNPGGPFWITPDDFLYFLAVDALTSATSAIARGRMRTEDGRTIPFSIGPLALDGSRTARLSNLVKLGAGGFIVDLAVQTTGTAAKRGQLYVQVLSGGGTGESTHGMLAQGYVYGGHAVALGEDVEPGPGGGEGSFRVVTGADPAADAEASDAVPTNAMWRLIAYQIALVSVVGSTAQPRLVVDTPTRIRKWWGGVQDPVAGAETQTFFWGRGNGTYADATPSTITDTEVVSPRIEIPDNLYMVEADVIRTLTFGTFGVGSNYGAPSITVEEWLVI